jgi:hypothetical protein
VFTHLKFSENIESDEMKNGGSLKNPWRIMLPRHQRGNFHNDFVEGIEWEERIPQGPLFERKL